VSRLLATERRRFVFCCDSIVHTDLRGRSYTDLEYYTTFFQKHQVKPRLTVKKEAAAVPFSGGSRFFRVS
ncbi:MAG: hypothetical protein IKT60_03375, partial [Clostridia bacterium]|nr:hypothetical protein [Clostridia bacterium]